MASSLTLKILCDVSVVERLRVFKEIGVVVAILKYFVGGCVAATVTCGSSDGDVVIVIVIGRLIITVLLDDIIISRQVERICMM